MKKTIYNLEAIVCIEVFDKKLDSSLEYVPPHRFLWEKVPESFKDYWTHYSREEVLNGKPRNDGIQYLIIDNKAYFKPKVVITFVGGKTCIIQFDTVGEAHHKANLLKSDNLSKTLESIQG